MYNNVYKVYINNSIYNSSNADLTLTTVMKFQIGTGRQQKISTAAQTPQVTGCIKNIKKIFWSCKNQVVLWFPELAADASSSTILTDTQTIFEKIITKFLEKCLSDSCMQVRMQASMIFLLIFFLFMPVHLATTKINYIVKINY